MTAPRTRQERQVRGEAGLEEQHQLRGRPDGGPGQESQRGEDQPAGQGGHAHLLLDNRDLQAAPRPVQPDLQGRGAAGPTGTLRLRARDPSACTETRYSPGFRDSSRVPACSGLQAAVLALLAAR